MTQKVENVFAPLESELGAECQRNPHEIKEHYALVFKVKDMSKFLAEMDSYLSKYLDHKSESEIGAEIIACGLFDSGKYLSKSR